jgi:hypothetical protein
LRGLSVVVVALLLCVSAIPVAAQPPAEANFVDAGALGIDLGRVQRGVQTLERDRQDGLNLEVFITVFGEAPPLMFLPQGDNEPFFVGPPADGPPTHADLMRIRTPREFMVPIMDVSAAGEWLRDQFRSDSSDER